MKVNWRWLPVCGEKQISLLMKETTSWRMAKGDRQIQVHLFQPTSGVWEMEEPHWGADLDGAHLLWAATRKRREGTAYDRRLPRRSPSIRQRSSHSPTFACCSMAALIIWSVPHIAVPSNRLDVSSVKAEADSATTSLVLELGLHICKSPAELMSTSEEN